MNLSKLKSHVIDAEFAPFFLRQIVGYRSQNNYSFIDDLATLDQDLYKNLSFIKVALFNPLMEHFHFITKNYFKSMMRMCLTWS